CAAPGTRDDLASIETGAAIGQALRGSPDLAAAAGTVRFEMHVTTSEGGREALVLTTMGSADRAAGELAMQLDLAGMLGGVPADELPPGMGEPARVVVAEGTIYLRIPLLDELTGTSGWLAGSPEEMDVPGASEPTGGRGIYDPFALLDLLHGARNAGEADGRDDVRGVPATRYSATVRIGDALDAIPEDRRVALQAQLAQLGGGDAPIPVEVWVDGDGLPRRLTMSFVDPASVGTAEEVYVAITIELFDYGLPVSIAVPRPDEVTPYGEAMGAMARAFLESGA
ncbi:MAG: hypothetical protein ABIP36_01230, partial [Acidimicrobiales bacterium]